MSFLPRKSQKPEDKTALWKEEDTHGPLTLQAGDAKSTHDLQAREIGRWQSSSVRKVMLASFIAATVLVIGLALFKLVWFRAEILGVELELGLLLETPREVLELGEAYLLLGALVALASIYLAVRMTVVGASVLFDRPIGHALLFGSLRRGLANVVVVLGIAIAMAFADPDPHVVGFEVDHLERAWGGYVLIAAIACQLFALLGIASDPAIAATQDWYGW
jgi:hypothetical protein